MNECSQCQLIQYVSVFPYHCHCGKVFHERDSEAVAARDLECKAKMVGTRLKNLIAWFPVPMKIDCRPCSRMEAKMNAWGPEKCRKKIPYILAKLRIAAKRRGLPFSERLVRILVEKAING